MARTKIARADLLHLGSLITYKDNEIEHCLGYLMNFEGHGIYEPTFGRLDLTPEEADAHNKALDKGMLEGLDKHCDVGMHGTFYYGNGEVRTFLGTLVSSNVHINGKGITFKRHDMTFRGILQKNADCFNFERIA